MLEHIPAHRPMEIQLEQCLRIGNASLARQNAILELDGKNNGPPSHTGNGPHTSFDLFLLCHIICITRVPVHRRSDVPGTTTTYLHEVIHDMLLARLN